MLQPGIARMMLQQAPQQEDRVSRAAVTQRLFDRSFFVTVSATL